MPKTYKDYVQSIYEAMADPNVAKGVGEYIKIGADKIKTHPSFRDMFKKMGKGYLQTTGPKYIKIWDTERGQKRSIAAFIDKVSGDVLKPAGVNAPAKGARGNVLDRIYMDQLRRSFDVHGGHLYSRHSLSYIFKKRKSFT